jgi:iron(III) transport system ATP-binding protein
VSAALEVRGLAVGYPGRPVLRGIDLTVAGGVTAVVGPSGCGKTTLLRTIAGFHAPESGTISIAGRDVAGPGRAVPARSRGLGFVPQEGALFPHLSVAANVAFGLPRGERRSLERARELLAMVDLPVELLDRYPRDLSGGQQQRVALARALAPRPALVLLDEPFSSLDAGLREGTGRAVVAALRSAGASALIVTHDQGEALSLADQVAVMIEGRFLQVSAPAQVYLAPADPRVASFIGHATLLPGVATSRAAATCALGALPLRTAVAPGPVEVAVRAEQVQVHRAGGLGVEGVVEDVSFYGHDAAATVRLHGGERIAARIPATGVPESGVRVRVEVLGEVVAFSTAPTPTDETGLSAGEGTMVPEATA